MSRRRSTLLTINAIAASLSKVVLSSPDPIIRFQNPIVFRINYSTAIQRSDFWNRNGANNENPLVKEREFGGETQKGLGFWDSGGENYQRNGEFEGNLVARRSERGREDIGFGARRGGGDGLSFDGRSGNFDGFGGNQGNRWGIGVNREAGYRNDFGNNGKWESSYNGNAGGFGQAGGAGIRGDGNRQIGVDDVGFASGTGGTRSDAGCRPSSGNYGMENNVMDHQRIVYNDNVSSKKFGEHGGALNWESSGGLTAGQDDKVQGTGGRDERNARLNQPIWSYPDGNQASIHQSPALNGQAGNFDVRQQFPSNPYMVNAGIPVATKHNYQQGNMDSFQSMRNGSYLGSEAQNQTNPSYNVNSIVGRYQQHSNGYDNTSIHMPASVSTTPDEESAETQPYEGTLEELDKACQESNMEEAVEILDLLDEKQIAVDLPRHLLLLKACAKAKSLEEAKAVHEHLVRSLSPLDISTYNMIIEIYSKCGSMQDAYDVFCVMPERNLTSWDAMITWLAKNELGEDALDVFAQFKQAGLTPDGPMFIGVFAACGVLGDVTEGMLHFDSMRKAYGIVPTMEHYVALVDMLGTSGCLEEALEFIENMPVEPSLQVWETLMNLCRIQGDLDLGNRCAKIIEELDPSYLNESSKAGVIPVRPSDVVKKEEKKKSGTDSLLEIRSKVHEFRAGDKSAPDTDKIYQLLKGLKEQMKDEGYVAETRFVLHDVQQEEKEEAIMSHSERLAAASSFLKSSARHEVRIIKNLRACVDCHNAFKIISKIVGRRFIIRDAKRFHHVEDGKCSCNDYW